MIICDRNSLKYSYKQFWGLFSSRNTTLLEFFMVTHQSVLIYCRKFMTLSNQTPRCIFKCIRICKLGDNCIQKFSFGEVYRRIYGRKFSFTATRERSRKCDFRTYIRRYTVPNGNFEYGYPHSNALLQFCLKFERCKPCNVARHQTKYGVINNVKMFLQYIAGYTVANFWRYPIRSRVAKGSALEYIV